MLHPVSEVAEMETRLGPTGRYVDPVFQDSRRHFAGFVRDLVKAGSVRFVEAAVEHVGLFGAQRFIVDARASNRHFVIALSGPLLAGEGLCRVEFQGAPEDTVNWSVISADIKNAFHQMRSLTRLQAFFALSAVLASEVGSTQKTSCSRFFVMVCMSLQHFHGFFSDDVFLSRCSRFSLFLFVVAAPHHRCSVANMAWDRVVSVGRMLTLWGVLARGANCTNVKLPRLIAGVKKAGPYVYEISLDSGSADVLGCESVSSQRVLQWNGQTDITYSFSRMDGFFSPSH